MASGKDTGGEGRGIVPSIRPVLVFMTILSFIGIFPVSCKQSTGEISAREVDTNRTENTPGLSAILFVNELSCPCTREQCGIAEGVVQRLKRDFSWGVRFETIDYELQNEKAKPLMQKYNQIEIPFLLVLDGDRLLWKCNDFSDENAVRTHFEELVLATLDVKKE